jgi:hypothetical protein
MAVSRPAMDAPAGGPGLLKLLGGLLLPPLAWFLDLQTSYATVRWACHHHSRILLLLVPLGSLGVIVLATWLSWSSWSDLRDGADLGGGTVPDRSAFVAVIGLLMGATFAFLVLLTFAARWVLNPCV